MPARPADVSDARFLLEQVASAPDKIRVILDVGAQILNLDNQQVAQLWLDMSRDDTQIKGAVFVRENGEICVTDRGNRVDLLSQSQFAGQLGLCLVYLDDAHTRGIDLRLPRDYRAAVTLGSNLTKDRLIQGERDKET